jgi:hypothetical protein
MLQMFLDSPASHPPGCRSHMPRPHRRRPATPSQIPTRTTCHYTRMHCANGACDVASLVSTRERLCRCLAAAAFDPCVKCTQVHTASDSGAASTEPKRTRKSCTTRGDKRQANVGTHDRVAKLDLMAPMRKSETPVTTQAMEKSVLLDMFESSMGNTCARDSGS